MTRSKKGHYYSDNEPYVVEWLKNLMGAWLIPAGDVDGRSIRDVSPDDVRGYVQCHWFAGIGGWPLALRLAGWPEDREVWTGSCPCQPFSAAGKRKGTADERHLWPDFRKLIEAVGPATVFGEQVASKDGRVWLAGVRSDMARMGYDFGAADLCAAGAGAPHIRQRLWWVADTDGRNTSAERKQRSGKQRLLAADRGVGGGVAEPNRWERGRLSNGEGCVSDRTPPRWQQSDGVVERGGAVGELGDAERDRRNAWRTTEQPGEGDAAPGARAHAEPGRSSNLGFWSDYDIVHCLDGKARRVGPGIQPLAHGVLARTSKLRAVGNAIVPQVAAEFIVAFMECAP